MEIFHSPQFCIVICEGKIGKFNLENFGIASEMIRIDDTMYEYFIF